MDFLLRLYAAEYRDGPAGGGRCQVLLFPMHSCFSGTPVTVMGLRLWARGPGASGPPGPEHVL